MKQQLNFSSNEEAFQYLADQIGLLSVRISALEMDKMAHEVVLKWMIYVIQQHDGVIQDDLMTMLDTWRENTASSDATEEAAKAVRSIQKTMEDIITGGQASPKLSIIEGGKE